MPTQPRVIATPSSANTPEEELVARAASGDGAAFERGIARDKAMQEALSRLAKAKTQKELLAGA